ncbi:MAG TPA: S9 family peptidase, partial [Pirellulales bacterium]
CEAEQKGPAAPAVQNSPAEPKSETAANDSAKPNASAAANPTAEPKQSADSKTETPLIPRSVLFGNPDKAMARMSHDGKLLAFAAPVKNEQGQGVLNIWVGPIDHPEDAKPVTHETKRPIQGYFWAYTNKHILYSQDENGDENFHVYAVNLDTGETKDITQIADDKPADSKPGDDKSADQKQVDAKPGDEKNAAPKPEPKKVRAEIEGVSWKNPEEIVIGLNDRDPEFHDLYLVNITNGDRKLIQKNTEYEGFVVDDDYKVRFASKMADDGGDITFKPDGNGGWTEYMKVGMEDNLTTSIAGFDGTGEVLYLIDSRGRDTGALKTVDLKTNEEKLVAENPLADVGGIMAHPKDNTLQAVSFTYDRTKWNFFDKEVEADFNRLKQVADGEILVRSRTLDDRKWIVAFLMDDGPVRFYFYDRDTKEPKFLFTSSKAMESLPMQKMHSEVIEARDGLKLVSYLTLPPGTDPKKIGRPDHPLPLVLAVHGGPWARDDWGLNGEHQLWANRGYAVLSVNYRGSTGFGKKFVNAGNKEWSKKMHDDLLDAVDWAVKEKIADPAKVAIVGTSYGGYATLVGLTYTPDKFACGIDECGPSNLITLLKTIPPYWAPEIEQFKKRVGDPTTPEGVKLLEDCSPLNKVDQIKRPLLIGQGKFDPRVKQAEADQMVKAMQAKKIPVTYVLVLDEGHGFHRPENSLAFNAISEAFLAKILGGRFEPIGTALDGSAVTVPAGADEVSGLAAALKDMPVQKSEPADGLPAGEAGAAASAAGETN